MEDSQCYKFPFNFQEAYKEPKWYGYNGYTTISILLVRKANAKGSVSGFEIAPLSKGGGSDKHLAVN